MIMTSDYSYIDDKMLTPYNCPCVFKIEYGDVISLDFNVYVSDIDVYSISICSNINHFHTNNFRNIKNRKEIRKSFLECIDNTPDLSMKSRNKRWKQQTEQVIDSLQQSVEFVFQKIFLKACGL